MPNACQFKMPRVFQFALIAMLSYTFLYAAVSVASTSNQLDISKLIDQLDDQRFESRESATRALVAVGEDALRSLAHHYYQASPEAAWRIKRILQDIGTQSTQEITSLKAIGLLVLIDQQLDAQLFSLLQAWRENRSQRAIEFLVSKGGEFKSQNPAQQIVIRNGIRRINIAVPRPSVNPLRTTKAKRKISRKEAKSKIEDLVDGELEEIQQFVFSQIPSQPSTNRSNGAFINDVFVGGGIAVPTSPRQQTVIEIGTNWKGTQEDLQKLREIHSLYGLVLRNQKLRLADFKFLDGLDGLVHIGFDDLKIEGQHLFDLNLPDSITSIEFRKQNLERETARWLSTLPLTSLTIDECRCPKSFIDELQELSSLQSVRLKRINLKSEFFDVLAKMPTVQSVALSVCKFSKLDYRRFARTRPRVMDFLPVSFLGVRGTPSETRPGTFSCKIEEVIPNSGAAAAGVKTGDIVTAVNGNNISNFDELRMFISQLDIGETMKLQVLRGDEELELSATLGTNKDYR